MSNGISFSTTKPMAQQKFKDYSVYKKVPNLDSLRAKRINMFNYVGSIILILNSVVWSYFWVTHDNMIMFIMALLFFPLGIFVIKWSKAGAANQAFTFLTIAVAIWITICVFVVSGPGLGYGGSAHSNYLTLAALIFFSLIGRPKLEQWGLPGVLIFAFIIFELAIIDFTPMIILDRDVMEMASYGTWGCSLATIFGFFLWLANDVYVVEQRLNLSNAKMEELLQNILPPSIAQKLSSDGKTFAEGFEHCTVLFADIVNFTQITKEHSAEELVAMLNKLFTEFDDATQHFEVEKIKTIGDAYMVAAGVPVAVDDHAHKMVLLAQRFITIIENYPELDIRLGINTGPVTAGVIGKKKFIYDLWGDTVNIAARMEQYGIKNKIQISDTTYQLIKERFSCTPRGEISVKGAGVITAYLVN